MSKISEFNQARAAKQREAQLTNYDILDNDCWKWRGALDKDGYGKLKRKGFKGGPQHLFYTIHIGPIPEGKILCHSCDNPWCVNPKHLWPGTHLENEQDKDKKGRRKGFVNLSVEEKRKNSIRGGESLRDKSTPEERSSRASIASKTLSKEQRSLNGTSALMKLSPEERIERATQAGKLGGVASGIARRRKRDDKLVIFNTPIGWEVEE